MKALTHRQQMGKMAYLLRRHHQLSWIRIAELTGYSDPGNCLRGARRYADNFGRDFPEKKHGSVTDPSDLFMLGKLARLRQRHVIIVQKSLQKRL